MTTLLRIWATEIEDFGFTFNYDNARFVHDIKNLQRKSLTQNEVYSFLLAHFQIVDEIECNVHARTVLRELIVYFSVYPAIYPFELWKVVNRRSLDMDPECDVYYELLSNNCLNTSSDRKREVQRLDILFQDY